MNPNKIARIRGAATMVLECVKTIDSYLEYIENPNVRASAKAMTAAEAIPREAMELRVAAEQLARIVNDDS